MRLGERAGEDALHVAPVAVDRAKIKTDPRGDDQQIDEPVDELDRVAVADRWVEDRDHLGLESDQPVRRGRGRRAWSGRDGSGDRAGRPARRSDASRRSAARGRTRREARRSVGCRRRRGIRWRASSGAWGRRDTTAAATPPASDRRSRAGSSGSSGLRPSVAARARTTGPRGGECRRASDAFCDQAVVSRQPEPQRPDRGRVDPAGARGDLLGVQVGVALRDVRAVQAQQLRRDAERLAELSAGHQQPLRVGVEPAVKRLAGDRVEADREPPHRRSWRSRRLRRRRARLVHAGGEQPSLERGRELLAGLLGRLVVADLVQQLGGQLARCRCGSRASSRG